MNRFPPQRLTALFAAMSFAVFFIPSHVAAQQGACGAVREPLSIDGAHVIRQCSALQQAVRQHKRVSLQGVTECVINRQIDLPKNRDTFIDFAGAKLKGGGKNRFFAYKGAGALPAKHTIAFQNVEFSGGFAPLGKFHPQDPEQPACSYGYKVGSGGVIDAFGANVRLINVVAKGNKAAHLGPDVGGGVAHARRGSVCVIDSNLSNNTGSNGGAIYLLQANLEIRNTVMRQNEAVGEGGNKPDRANCSKTFGHQFQSGQGSIGGAIKVDGFQAGGVIMDSVICQGNKAGTIGACIARTSNQKTTPFIVRNSRFVGNESGRGGAIALFEVAADISNSVFINNRANMAAAIQIGNNTKADSSLTLTGNTFDSNRAMRFPVMTANIRGPIKSTGNRIVGASASPCKIGKQKNCGKGFAVAKAAPDDAETQADVAVEAIPELLLELCKVSGRYKFKGLGFHDGSVLLSENCP